MGTVIIDGVTVYILLENSNIRHLKVLKFDKSTFAKNIFNFQEAWLCSIKFWRLLLQLK